MKTRKTQVESGKDRLARHVGEKRETLETELKGLPTEYSSEAYARWVEINEELLGLAALSARFLKAPRVLSPEQKIFAELLY